MLRMIIILHLPVKLSENKWVKCMQVDQREKCDFNCSWLEPNWSRTEFRESVETSDRETWSWSDDKELVAGKLSDVRNFVCKLLSHTERVKQWEASVWSLVAGHLHSSKLLNKSLAQQNCLKLNFLYRQVELKFCL